MMNQTKKMLTLCAGNAAAVGAAFASVLILGAAVPVALGIGYVISGASIVAAISMHDE